VLSEDVVGGKILYIDCTPITCLVVRVRDGMLVIEVGLTVSRNSSQISAGWNVCGIILGKKCRNDED